jgi:hypothetical protein
MAANEEQARRRTPFSAKLPQVSLDDALEPVRALSELGAPATPHVIAQHLGTSYGTDARFRTRLGAAGYYGLIKKQQDKRALTERGSVITGSNGGDATRARREAVISTSFGPLIHSLRGRPVNESAIALRLQSDYSAPEASARRLAGALIDAATQAGLVADGRFDAVAIEEVASALPTPPEAAAAPTNGNGQAGRERTAAPRRATASQTRQDRQAEQSQPEVEQRRPFVPGGVQIIVKVDASKLSAQEIAELVRALQTPQT